VTSLCRAADTLYFAGGARDREYPILAADLQVRMGWQALCFLSLSLYYLQVLAPECLQKFRVCGGRCAHLVR
jgi:hypothetical protein